MTPWAVAHQAPLSMGFSRQEYWSELPFPPPGDLSNPRIKPAFLSPCALAGMFFIPGPTWEAQEVSGHHPNLTIGEGERKRNLGGTSWTALKYKEGAAKPPWAP